MHDTKLNLSMREDRLDGLWKTLQAVNTGNEDILNATVSQFGHNLEPELGAFGLGNPHPQDLLDSIHGNADGQVDCLVQNVPICPALYPDGIHIDNRIHGIQKPILPDLDLVIYGIGNSRDQGGRNLNTIDFLQVSLDLSGGHSPGIE